VEELRLLQQEQLIQEVELEDQLEVVIQEVKELVTTVVQV
jgi:hypothetical protein